MEALPSQHFGKFIRVSKLGEGGMGEVWKAWDDALRRWVALKVMKGFEESEVARFRREAEMAAKLVHPNIASIYEIGETDGRHWIAMQFVDGQTLSSYARKRGDLKMTIRVIRDCARAIAFAHSRRIIHRDVKPENLMVGEHGDRQCAMVMDFGLAKPMRSGAAATLTATGYILGSPAYMSPEAARGEVLDGRSDVWSLGVTLYELLTDHRPFVGRTAMDTLRAVEEAEPTTPRKLSVKIDCDLELIILKCIEKDRNLRYRSMNELADDLDRWLDGAPVRAHPASLFYRARRWMVRRRKVIVLVFSFLVAVLGVGLWYQSRANVLARERAVVGAMRLYNEGDVWAKQGDWDQAIACYDKSITLNSSHEGVWHARSMAKFRKGDLDGALSDVDRSLALEVTAEKLANRGACWFAKGDVQKAIMDCDRAIALDPGELIAYGVRFQAHMKEGGNDLALADVKRALELCPKDSPERANLEWWRKNLEDR